MGGTDDLTGQWGLVLGASSGFGAAAARALAASGMHVLGVHLDRKTTLPEAEAVVRDVEAAGCQAHFFNVNAADDEQRAMVCNRAAELVTARPLRVVLHSLAFGTLRPLVSADPVVAPTSRRQLEMTLDVMAHSFVYWVQDLLARGLVGRGTRIFAMTSAGGRRVLPAYGAVSAAKAALESHVRQLALELGPLAVAVNAIRAGVTDTPAARKIPNSQLIFDEVRRRNPGGRLTRPEDVAETIVALARGETSWVSGNVIGVDGGEDVVG
jgi:enoyl-[acyl-carrier protein] reductase III